MSFLKGLLNSVSGGALFSVAAAEADAKTNNDRIFGLRPTPRHPERHPGFQVASPHRAKQRRKLKTAYERGLAREKAIGVDPKYGNRRSERTVAAELDWALRSRQWDRANPVKADG